MMWSANRGLNQLVTDVICNKQTQKLHELENALAQAKPHFLSLLKDSPKRPSDREIVRKANKEPLCLVGIDQKVTLGEDFIDETLLISDILEMNEILSVELLLSAEGQLPSYPDLTRGLVAVLLFYDARRCLVESLRTLIQARRGRAWEVDLPEEVTRVVQTFTDSLWESELPKKILDALSALDMKQTVERLEKARGLGRARHRHQFRTLFFAIRTGLAECLLYWACQSPLAKEEVQLLLDFVAANPPLPAEPKVGAPSKAAALESGEVGWTVMDKSGPLLLMTALWAIDVSQLENAWDSSGDRDLEEEEKAAAHPALSDSAWVGLVNAAVKRASSRHNSEPSGAGSLVKLGWAQSLRRLAQCVDVAGCEGLDVTEEDEVLAEASIEEGVFPFTRRLLQLHPWIFAEEFCARRVHGVVTDFLVQMPLRVKELRNRGDEAARLLEQCRLEGVEPQKAPRRDFEQLLLLMGEFYAGEARFELCNDFWCQQDPGSSSPNFRAGPQGDISTSMFGRHSGASRLSYKQLALFKFVRLASDFVLVPSLFIPYLRMLCGLSNSRFAAAMCYSLLKANASLGGLQSGVISWDHFFRSLHRYLAAMRQELSSGAALLAADLSGLQPMQHTPHLYPASGRTLHKGITPEELEGLRNVLLLMRKVVAKDDVALTGMVESPDWQPVSLFFGLLSCGVPVALKAEMLETLAVFARSPQHAVAILRAFEASQILATPATGLARQRVTGLHTELDEVEPKTEEYPLGRAFLRLLLAISESLPPQVPASALHGPLRFALETLFLKHAMRAYRVPGERWEVAGLCLSLFDAHLERYLAPICDLARSPQLLKGSRATGAAGQTSEQDVLHPGFLVGCNLLTDSPLLKLMLSLLHEGLQELDAYGVDRSTCPRIVSCLTTGLQLLDRVLQRQEELLKVIRAQHSLVSSVRLSKLMMEVNVRSGRPDHLVIAVRLAAFREDAPEMARLALSVLSRCVLLVQPHRDLLTVLTADWNTRIEILRTLVDCLETEGDTEAFGDAGQELDESDGVMEERVSRSFGCAPSLRVSVLKILLASLDNPWPNLGHFLLGFRIDRQVRRTVLQEPGVMGFPKTCLHALFGVLELGSDRILSSHSLSQQQLWELALASRALYRLATSTDTCEATLRFCRHSRDLFVTQLPSLRRFPQMEDPALLGLLLYQKSWMLKLLAIELRINALTNQRLGLKSLARRLIGADSEGGEERSNWFEQITNIDQEEEKVLPVLFDQLDIPCIKEAPMPDGLQHMDAGFFSELVTLCEYADALGTRLVDVGRLSSLMRHEIASCLSEMGPSQAQAVVLELEGACQIAEAHNRLRLWSHGKQACLEGWRQVVEVLLTACPPDLMSWPARRYSIVDLLVRLLSDLAQESTPPPMRPLLSGTALNLVAELASNWARHTGTKDEEGSPNATGRGAMAAMEFVSLLDASVTLGAADGPQDSAELRVVLAKLLESIGTTSSSSQRVRANLYASLSHLLYIARMQDSSGRGRITRECLAVVGRMGDRLFDSICRDAADGHHVTRMCALAVLDRLLFLDRFSDQWLDHLVRLGYLQNLVDGLAEESKALEVLMQVARPGSLAPLFIYQSKLALLCRVAGGSAAGAKALMAAGVMQRLAECAVFSMRPSAGPQDDSFDDNTGAMDFLPNMTTRYWQVLEPALRLAFNLMTALGLENLQAAQGVLTFLDAHSDPLLGSLYFGKATEGPADFSLLRLRELALVASVLHLSACCGAEEEAEEGWPKAPFGHRESLSARIRRVVLALLPPFAAVLREPHASSTNALALEEKRCLRFSIVSSLLAFVGARLRTRRHFSAAYITFAADLGSAQAAGGPPPTKAEAVGRARPPLSLLTGVLRDSQVCLSAAIDALGSRSAKQRQLCELAREETRVLASDLGVTEASDEELARRLEKTVGFLEEQVLHLTAVIEHCCYLLWVHLDYYLARRDIQPAVVCEALHECLPCDTTLKRFSRGDPNRVEYMESFVRKLRRMASSVQFL